MKRLKSIIITILSLLLMSFQCGKEGYTSQWLIMNHTEETFIITYKMNGEIYCKGTLKPDHTFEVELVTGTFDFDYLMLQEQAFMQKLIIQSKDGKELKAWSWPASENEDSTLFTDEGLWRKLHSRGSKLWILDLTEEFLGLDMADK